MMISTCTFGFRLDSTHLYPTFRGAAAILMRSALHSAVGFSYRVLLKVRKYLFLDCINTGNLHRMGPLLPYPKLPDVASCSSTQMATTTSCGAKDATRGLFRLREQLTPVPRNSTGPKMGLIEFAPAKSLVQTFKAHVRTLGPT